MTLISGLLTGVGRIDPQLQMYRTLARGTDAELAERARHMTDPTKTIAVLDAVRDVLANPERWARRELAYNRLGEPVEPREPEATCWCLQGAINRVTDNRTAQNIAHHELRKTLFERGTHLAIPSAAVEFNDNPNTTHVDILQLIDDTIARLRTEAT